MFMRSLYTKSIVLKLMLVVIKTTILLMPYIVTSGVLELIIQVGLLTRGR